MAALSQHPEVHVNEHWSAGASSPSYKTVPSGRTHGLQTVPSRKNPVLHLKRQARDVLPARLALLGGGSDGQVRQVELDR